MERQNHEKCYNSDHEGEVTSPTPGKHGKLRPFLNQANASTPMDLESTNNRGPRYTVVSPSGSISYPLVNAFPPEPKGNVPKQKDVNTASSCASSSPQKWWRNPFKKN